MSSKSFTSILKSVNGKRGIPRKYDCGGDLVVLAAKTQLNPGRSFFRCANSRDDTHLFKWVKDVTFEATENILEKLESNETEMNNTKNVVLELKGELQGCKTELQKYKIMSKCLASFLGIVAVLILILYLIVLFKKDYNNLVVGY